MLAFPKRILFVGFGAVARCTLPILLKHISVDPDAHHHHGLRAKRGGSEALDRAGHDLRQEARDAGESGYAARPARLGRATSSSTWRGTSTAAKSCSGATTAACCTSTRRWSSGTRTPGRTTSTRPSGRSTGAT